jgi:hypothetical protein
MRMSGLAAAWMFVLVGCSSCTPHPSSDASPSDASDAAISAEGGPQTCSRAPGDPSFRCDLVASSPGWRRIGCLPACGIEIADDPARSDAPTLSWQPCADGRAGCTELGIAEREAAERSWSFVSSWTADRHLLWIVRTARSGGESQTHLLDARSGAVLFAARQRMGVPAECTQLPLAVQRSRALIGFTSWLPQAPYSGRIAIDLTETSATLQPPRIFDFASCGANFRASDCVSTSRGMVCITSARQVIRWMMRRRNQSGSGRTTRCVEFPENYALSRMTPGSRRLLGTRISRFTSFRWALRFGELPPKRAATRSRSRAMAPKWRGWKAPVAIARTHPSLGTYSARCRSSWPRIPIVPARFSDDGSARSRTCVRQREE